MLREQFAAIVVSEGAKINMTLAFKESAIR
jgi:hypothetical protein